MDSYLDRRTAADERVEARVRAWEQIENLFDKRVEDVEMHELHLLWRRVRVASGRPNSLKQPFRHIRRYNGFICETREQAYHQVLEEAHWLLSDHGHTGDTVYQRRLDFAGAMKALCDFIRANVESRSVLVSA